MARFKAMFDRKWLAAALVAALAVLTLTHIPQMMMPVQLQGHTIDKAEHVAAYGIIAFLFLMSFRRPPGPKVMGIVLVVTALLGAADEMTQPFVNRIASPIDLAADIIGGAAACVLFAMIRLYRRERPLRSVVQT